MYEIVEVNAIYYGQQLCTDLRTYIKACPELYLRLHREDQSVELIHD